MTATQTRTGRPAFTLVELLVSVALSIGIMWILAESFKMGLDFTRHAHATGEMMNQLNGAGAILTRDLQAEHFAEDSGRKNRGVRLSDQRLDQLASGGSQWTPPPGGYVRIYSPAPGSSVNDQEGFAINTVNPTALPYLQFTAVLPVGTDQNLFTVRSPANSTNVYQSRAAEVAYFLVPTGKTGAAGQQLYDLYRRQRLVALNDDEAGNLQPAVSDPDDSVVAGVAGTPGPPPTQPRVYTLADVTNPANRMPLTPYASGNRFRDDLLLSNVLSFDVQAEWTAGSTLPGSGGPRGFSSNSDAPADYLAYETAGGVCNTNTTANPKGTFDTWHRTSGGWNAPGNNAVPMAVRIRALQVTIRVFDPRTKMARQNTWKISM